MYLYIIIIILIIIIIVILIVILIIIIINNNNNIYIYYIYIYIYIYICTCACIVFFTAPFCHLVARQVDPRLQHGWWSGRGPQSTPVLTSPCFTLSLHNQDCKGPDIPGTSAMGGLTPVILLKLLILLSCTAKFHNPWFLKEINIHFCRIRNGCGHTLKIGPGHMVVS